MSKHLKKFSIHSEYDAYINGSDAILPNVSICTTEGDVHYNPSSSVPPTPMIDGHEYVDLGLPSGTKWATMNVGASSETDYGNYYKYGLGDKQYDNTQTNYTGTENPLSTSVDIVAQVWGGQWHMPTKTQFEELTANTTYEWTTINGVNGGKFTSQNGNYVFFAPAGRWRNGSVNYVGSNGLYWSSTPLDSDRAYYWYFYNGYTDMDYSDRDGGFSVRGVVG